jgi:antitoxin component YwqK of YwqJK toxin-antitoxin module
MRARLFALVMTALPYAAVSVQSCELNGQSVNPANGSTTAGKTGLMRCRDADGGPVQREQELKNGVFMGVVRYFKDGVLQREYHVNEQGNQDGLSREFAASAGKNTLLREETYRNSKIIGIARAWHPNGQLRHVAFHGDDGRSEAAADFTPQGQLKELRCAARPLLAPHADDAAWCGHGSTAATVPLYADSGTLRGRVTHERGERRKIELLWDNGKLREQQESSTAGGFERSFSAEGVKRREAQWTVGATADGRPRRMTTLEQEFHESGPLVRERRWKASERGELQLEQHWYLNGQPRGKVEYLDGDGRAIRRETRFHDNGRPAFEGSWLAGSRSGNAAIGVHKRYDAEGRLRSERHHDEKGRVTRERELDESGRITRDDEVFEDGSRKAYSR